MLSNSKVREIEPPIATKVNLTSQAISDDKLSSNKNNIFPVTNDTAVPKIKTSTVTVDSSDYKNDDTTNYSSKNSNVGDEDVFSDSKVSKTEPSIATKVNLTSQAISDDKFSSNKDNSFPVTNDTAVPKINTSTVTVDSSDYKNDDTTNYSSKISDVGDYVPQIMFRVPVKNHQEGYLL